MLSSIHWYVNKVSFKYFIGYITKTNAFPIPSCIKLSQMNGYVKYYDNNNKYINLLVHDGKLLKEYNEIWDKVENLFTREFDSKPVYKNEYIKTKQKFTMVEYMQTFNIIKYQKIISIVLAYL